MIGNSKKLTCASEARDQRRSSSLRLSIEIDERRRVKSRRITTTKLYRAGKEQMTAERNSNLRLDTAGVSDFSVIKNVARVKHFSNGSPGRERSCRSSHGGELVDNPAMRLEG